MPLREIPTDSEEYILALLNDRVKQLDTYADSYERTATEMYIAMKEKIIAQQARIALETDPCLPPPSPKPIQTMRLHHDPKPKKKTGDKCIVVNGELLTLHEQALLRFKEYMGGCQENNQYIPRLYQFVAAVQKEWFTSRDAANVIILEPWANHNEKTLIQYIGKALNELAKENILEQRRMEGVRGKRFEYRLKVI